MAITTPSSSNKHTPLQTISISFHPKKSCSSSSSSSQQSFKKFKTCSSLSFSINNTTKIAAAAAAAETKSIQTDDDYAAAVFAASEFERILGCGEIDDIVDDDDEGNWDLRNGSMVMRRKMRRKRRKTEMKNFGNQMEIKNVCLKPWKEGRFLTKKAEAEYCFWLKEEARVEALRKSIEENGGRKLTLTEWSTAAGMSRLSLDMILCNGRVAEERIINSYTKLVASIAFTYQGKGLCLEDLIQEGKIGLLHGAKKFNPEKGCKLSTYVYWWIRQAITRAITRSKIIKLPGSINELVPRICEANGVFSRKMHRWPTPEELANVVNKDIVTVGLALRGSRDPISIDQTVSNRVCLPLQEIIEGPKETTPEEMIKKHFMKKDIEKLLNEECDIREINIIKLYYGLNGDVPLSFEEIGKRFNLSRERVRQICWNAMCKLKQARNILDFKSYVYEPYI